MTARSLLFVPGDSDKKLEKAQSVGADLLILDLEDAVAPERKAHARMRVAEYVAAHPTRTRTALWVRINPLGTAEALADLDAVMGVVPDGIVQPKTDSPQDVIRLAAELDRLELRHGIRPGSTRILPVATETPAAVFNLGGFRACGPRLYGLTWGAEDLSAAVGATASRLPDGSWTTPFQVVRALTLFGAHAAGVAAIDTLAADFRNSEALRRSCAEGRRDGFVGKLAIHPDQVAVINECFTPTADEIAHARQVVQLFAANPGAGALSLNGQMVDRPHLKQAEAILARI